MLAVLGSACEREQVVLGPGALFDDATKTAILFLLDPDVPGALPLETRGFDPRADVPLVLERPEGEAFDVHLLTYHRSIAELGLLPGELLRARPEETSVPLTTSTTAHAARLDVQDGEPDWHVVEFEDTAASGWPIPAQAQPCEDTFDVVSWKIEGLEYSDIQSVLPLSESQVLVSGYRGDEGGFLGSVDGSGEYTSFLEGWPAHIRDLGIDSKGVVYATTSSVTLLAFDLQQRTITATRALPLRGWGLTLITDDTFFVYHGGSSTAYRVQTPALDLVPFELPDLPKAMIAQAPNRILVRAGDPKRAIYVYDGTEWTKELDEFDFFQATASVGNKDKAIFILDERPGVRHADGRWELVPAFGTLRDLRNPALLRGDNYLLAGGGGNIIVWLDGAWCPIRTGVSRASRDANSTPDGRVVFTSSWAHTDGDGAQVTRLIMK